jgi:hypothetical protein
MNFCASCKNGYPRVHLPLGLSERLFWYPYALKRLQKLAASSFELVLTDVRDTVLDFVGKIESEVVTSEFVSCLSFSN